jgi:hypothetical protein
MRTNPIFFIAVVSIVILLIDFYSYRGVKKVISDYNTTVKRTIRIFFWLVPAILITGLVIVSILRDVISAEKTLIFFHFVSGTFILFYVPKLIFIIFNLIDDLLKGGFHLFKKVKKEEIKSDSVNKITRSQFLTRIGILTAAVPFLAIAYGIGYGRFDLTVRKLKLSFSNLPKKFNGLKIVQISDFHIGSFLNHVGFVENAVDKINSLKPDLILFTGDMVNNLANELDKFIEILSRLNAKYGKYSVLGNHDYGEYVPWKSFEEKKENLEQVIKNQRLAGFDLILNDNRKIVIDDEQIELIGIENWGLPPFPQYGDLNKAMVNVDKNSFKILLSHDPTHWDEQVLGYTNIELSLAGHTHGAQFGIEIPGWRWSPVNMRYKRWGGLYTENNQHLNVNTGIGFIGFPGRVGMPPEISLIELET